MALTEDILTITILFLQFESELRCYKSLSYILFCYFVSLTTCTLDIRNKSQLNGLNVPDASLVPVTCTQDVLELMKIGQKNRAVGATALNERSSRSHR